MGANRNRCCKSVWSWDLIMSSPLVRNWLGAGVGGGVGAPVSNLFNGPEPWQVAGNMVDNGDGTFTASAGAATVFKELPQVIEGATYEFTYILSSRTAGAAVADVNGTGGTARNSNGTWVQNIIAGVIDDISEVRSNGALVGVVEPISLIYVSGP